MDSTPHQRLDGHIFVGDSWSWGYCQQRGCHDIEDEFIFTNYNGYVFHDSNGFEAGSQDEFRTVQEFVTRRSREKRLRDRLHAIWLVLQRAYSHGYRTFPLRFCIPMDSNRPSLDMKYFADICPNKNGMSKLNWYFMNDWPEWFFKSLW